MDEELVIRRLVSAARTVQRRAHAPYSNFHVGAALYTERGRIVSGCNVENASYGLTICAERGAIMQLVAEDAGRPVYCVVVGPTAEPLTPCGACRQVLAEFNRQMVVVCVGKDGAAIRRTVDELLPAAFDATALT